MFGKEMHTHKDMGMKLTAFFFEPGVELDSPLLDTTLVVEVAETICGETDIDE